MGSQVDSPLLDLGTACFKCALGEVNRLTAALTNMCLFEFVRKDLLFLAAIGTLANKR
jgi:hypothetical protein